MSINCLCCPTVFECQNNPEYDYEPEQQEDDYFPYVDGINDYNDDVEIDKCLYCGKYRATKNLTYPEQNCVEGCKSPNEY